MAKYYTVIKSSTFESTSTVTFTYLFSRTNVSEPVATDVTMLLIRAIAM